MTSLHISVCVFIVIYFGYALAKPTCGPNEVIDECPRNCSYEYCPKNESQDAIPCLKPITCPPPSCKCIFNYRRAENGTCIPTQQCPAFECTRPNEYYDPCPSYCPGDDCRNANPTGECPYSLLLVVTCSPACRCTQHHWRHNSVCVSYLDCPGVKEEAEIFPLERIII